ncbi:lipopolysaccharide core heptose(II) kinase RfaY [Triangularia setosa]|uniref:Lipopolysaccharide core heptose(II) kinase RfaY n=1 Tax=Triangularia setosa TaxID=2587417 RepID=A0AAN6WCW5_9PEZI|nr:lipopolysaccharide core heptose(II) kinase RfaY [Podospora setosa]
METSRLPPPPVCEHEFKIELPRSKRPGGPEHYRLPAQTRIKYEPPATLVHFWFRTRFVSAFATCLSNIHPHILRLHIRPSTAASLVGSCVRLVPGFAQFWVHVAFPEWFLPDHIVLKQQKQGEEEVVTAELFDTEVQAYNRLQPLQGMVVPTCYGRLHYNGTRALILEYLGGTSLSSPEGVTLRLEELSALLQPCYRALHAFGVHHDITTPTCPTFVMAELPAMHGIMVCNKSIQVDSIGARTASRSNLPRPYQSPTIPSR